MGKDFCERLRALLGFAVPGLSVLAALWPARSDAGLQPAVQLTPPEPRKAGLRFESTLNAGATNIYARHGSHSSHASHSSHSSHYSSSGGSYYTPPTPSYTPSPYVAPTPSAPSYTPPQGTTSNPTTPSYSPSRTTPSPSEPASNPAPSRRINPLSPEAIDIITRAQIALERLHYDVIISGQMDMQTRDALGAFQLDRRLMVTGTLTTETLDALGIKLR